MRQRGPAARQTKVLAVICDAMARDMSLSCKRPGRGRRAQFQLWIFSYTGFARPSKKWLSRVMIGFGDGAASTGPNGLRCAENSVSHLSRAP